MYRPIPGATECLNTLKKLGKKVRFITNNSSTGLEVIISRLKVIGYRHGIEDICNPAAAIIDYLKKIKFDKQLYVIATSTVKNDLKNAGFTVIPDPVCINLFHLNKYQ